MNVIPTDAHCHFNAGKIPALEGMEVCASACYPEEWGKLDGFCLVPIKKAYGLHPDLGVSGMDDIAAVEAEIFASYLPKLELYLSGADAVGEMGLDARFKDRIPLRLQSAIFTAQLGLARKYSLPIIVHCVDSWGALLEILKDEYAKNSELKFMLHAAKCSAELVSQFAKIGGYFSFGIRELLSPRGEATLAAVEASRILSESDSDKTSSESMLRVVEKMSDLRRVPFDELGARIESNFKTFFAK